MPGIGVINNPRSRQNRKDPDRLRQLAYMLGTGGESKATWNFEELDLALAEFRERDIDILAINGGDGSNHVTLTHLINVYGDKPLPKIALLRGGTLNTISNACGIKGSTHWLLYNLTEKYAKGEPFETIHRDLMKIGDMYGFLFGNGVVANFMETYYTTGTPSPSHGAKVLARAVGSAIVRGPLIKSWFKKLEATVTADGEVFPRQGWTTIMGAGISEIGLGFTPWPRCEEEPNSFHILMIDCSAIGILFDLPHMYFGRNIHPRVGHEFVARNVVIEADHPWPYTIDGDMHVCQSGRMVLEVGPRLEIIRK